MVQHTLQIEYVILNRKKNIIPKLFLILLTLTGCMYSQSEEHILKAAYFEKFALFTEWPQAKSDSDEVEKFRIGVFGECDMFPALTEFFRNQKINNMDVHISIIEDLENVEQCHMLFIPKDNNEQLETVLQLTSAIPVLTISDTPGFCDRGVMINLFIKDDRIKFEINESAVKRSGLYMSYHLLKYAKIISPVRS